MDHDLIYLLVYSGVILATGFGAVGLSFLFGPVKKRRVRLEEKLAPYECGVPLKSDAHQPASITFYLVAILFVVFDVEVLFLLPWAVVYEKLGMFGLVEMTIFIAVLALGLLYIIKRGIFSWQE